MGNYTQCRIIASKSFIQKLRRNDVDSALMFRPDGWNNNWGNKYFSTDAIWKLASKYKEDITLYYLDDYTPEKQIRVSTWSGGKYISGELIYCRSPYKEIYDGKENRRCFPRKRVKLLNT